MKNIAIGVLLASLLVACASDVPVGDLKKSGRPANVPQAGAADSAPGASVVVDTLSDQNSVSQTSKSASASAEEVAAKAVAEEAAAKAVAEEAAAKAVDEKAAAKAVDEEAALAAARAAEVQNAELEAAKASAAQAAADAAAAREAASAAAAREAANAAKVAAELEAAKASSTREAANAAKVTAELEAAKASAARAAADAAAARHEAAANAAAAQNAARDTAKAIAAREKAAEDAFGILAKHSVYYPTDIDVVPAQDKLIVYAHAKYLTEHPNRSVRLEGHADERGSSEYNLALGQRRADGVKKMLIVGGVKEGLIESVSYGEEKPVATAHNEAAWSQNRRTDLNYNVK